MGENMGTNAMPEHDQDQDQPKIPNLETFQLTDKDGNPHDYSMSLHPAAEGQRIMWKLYAAAAEPLAGLADAAFNSKDIFSSLDMDGGLMPALQKVQGKIDVGRVGKDLKNAILDLAMAELTTELLKHTVRDGKKLAVELEFNAAYTGNYWELVKAVWKGIDLNGFFPLSGISRGLDLGMKMLKAEALNASAKKRRSDRQSLKG